jgi:hypothetical protein
MKTTRRTFCKAGAAAAALRPWKTASAASSVSPGSLAGQRPRLLHPQDQLERWSFWSNRDWDWYEQNLPFWESPDPKIDEIYYYRAEVLTKHLRYASPETGYIFTEFSNADSLPWAGRYNGIASAADLHFEEARWLKSRRYTEDYARYWMKTPGAQPRNYGFAAAWSAWQMGLVHGSQQVAESLLDQYVENFEIWEKGRTDYPHDNGFDPQRRLFWNTGRDVGGEFNLASCQLSESLRGIEGYKIRGGAGYRPDINALMFAEADTIAAIARSVGNAQLAMKYTAKASSIRQRTQTDLWDARRSFFLHRWRRDEYSERDTRDHRSIREWSMIWDTNSDRNGGVGYQPDRHGLEHGRELTGYIPWRYGLPEDNADLASAWQFLISPQHFQAPFGLTTAERGDPWYHVVYHACRHNGQSWPFHTSRTLTAGARFLADYRHHGDFTREAWMDIFSGYVRMQYERGKPHLAEAHHPDKDLWVQNEWPGLDYFHSSYINLVLTGIAGLRPSDDGYAIVKPLAPRTWDYFAADRIAYRNHELSIVWDRTGSRYGIGQGFTILVDGEVAAHSATLDDLRVPLPALKVAPQPYEVVVSANAEGKPYPKPSASFTAKYTPESAALDGLIWYDQEYGDKWTCRGSWNSEDWFKVEFAAAIEVSALRLHLYADQLEVVAPDSITCLWLQDGQWTSVQLREITPAVPTAGRANTLRFDPVTTKAIRVVFKHPIGLGVGLAQLQVLAPLLHV